jgi:hypothetical protein
MKSERDFYENEKESYASANHSKFRTEYCVNFFIGFKPHTREDSRDRKNNLPKIQNFN